MSRPALLDTIVDIARAGQPKRAASDKTRPKSSFAKYWYRAVWENLHGERFYADPVTNADYAMGTAREAVDEGRINVRVEVVAIEESR